MWVSTTCLCSCSDGFDAPNCLPSGDTGSDPETDDCVLPSEVPEGYEYSDSPTISYCNPQNCASPTFTGVTCAEGYEGVPTTFGCFAGVLVVALDGCSPEPLVPVTYEFRGDWNMAALEGYEFSLRLVFAAAANVSGSQISSIDIYEDGDETVVAFAFSGTQAQVDAVNDQEFGKILEETLIQLNPDLAAAMNLGEGGCNDNFCNGNGAATWTGSECVCACTRGEPPNCKISASCVLPDTVPEGYDYAVGTDITSCTASNCSSPSLGISCAEGFQGTPNTTGCSKDNLEITLSGCTAIVFCTLPDTPPEGYDYPEDVDLSLSSCTARNCTSSSLSEVSCEDGFEGTPNTTGCSEDNTDLDLTGCTSIVYCTLPEVAPDGFSYLSEPTIVGCTTSNCTFPEISGVTCGDDFEGIPNVTAHMSGCSERDTEVTLAGCGQAPACSLPETAPSGYVYDADADVSSCDAMICTEPTLTGVTCADGDEGTPSVNITGCTDEDLSVTLNGCSLIVDCTMPYATPDGYLYLEAPSISMCTTTHCASPIISTISCANGYEGIATVNTTAVCSEEDTDVSFTGCETTQPCNLPPTADGYTFESDASMDSCTVWNCTSGSMSGVSCADGFYGIPSPESTGCSSDNMTVSLTGCDPLSSILCTLPSEAPDGYELASDTSLALCDAANCSNPTLNGISCADMFQGTPIVASGGCTGSSTEVSLSGCMPEADIVCTMPVPAPDGYLYHAAPTIDECTPEDCTAPIIPDVVCANGYRGAPVVTSGCTVTSTDVTLTGCVVEGSENSGDTGCSRDNLCDYGPNGCTPSRPCDEYQGDCDTDADCAGDLVCQADSVTGLLRGGGLDDFCMKALVISTPVIFTSTSAVPTTPAPSGTSTFRLSGAWAMEDLVPYTSELENMMADTLSVDPSTVDVILNQGQTVTPPEISDATLLAFYDARDTKSLDSSDGALSQWNDISGNERHLTQNVFASQPRHAFYGDEHGDWVVFNGNKFLQTEDFSIGDWPIYAAITLNLGGENMQDPTYIFDGKGAAHSIGFGVERGDSMWMDQGHRFPEMIDADYEKDHEIEILFNHDRSKIAFSGGNWVSGNAGRSTADPNGIKVGSDSSEEQSFRIQSLAFFSGEPSDEGRDALADLAPETDPCVMTISFSISTDVSEELGDSSFMDEFLYSVEAANADLADLLENSKGVDILECKESNSDNQQSGADTGPYSMSGQFDFATVSDLKSRMTTDMAIFLRIDPGAVSMEITQTDDCDSTVSWILPPDIEVDDEGFKKYLSTYSTDVSDALGISSDLQPIDGCASSVYTIQGPWSLYTIRGDEDDLARDLAAFLGIDESMITDVQTLSSPDGCSVSMDLTIDANMDSRLQSATFNTQFMHYVRREDPNVARDLGWSEHSRLYPIPGCSTATVYQMSGPFDVKQVRYGSYSLKQAMSDAIPTHVNNVDIRIDDDEGCWTTVTWYVDGDYSSTTKEASFTSRLKELITKQNPDVAYSMYLNFDGIPPKLPGCGVPKGSPVCYTNTVQKLCESQPKCFWAKEHPWEFAGECMFIQEMACEYYYSATDCCGKSHQGKYCSWLEGECNEVDMKGFMPTRWNPMANSCVILSSTKPETEKKHIWFLDNILFLVLGICLFVCFVTSVSLWMKKSWRGRKYQDLITLSQEHLILDEL